MKHLEPTASRRGFSSLLFLLLLCDWIILSLLFSVPTGGIGLESRIGLPFAAATRGTGGGTMGVSWGGLVLDLLIVATLAFLFSPRGERKRSDTRLAGHLLHRPYLYTGALALWGLLSFAFATDGMAADGENRAGLPMAVIVDYMGRPAGALVHQVSWSAFLADMLCVVLVVEGSLWWVGKRRP